MVNDSLNFLLSHLVISIMTLTLEIYLLHFMYCMCLIIDRNPILMIFLVLSFYRQNVKI